MLRKFISFTPRGYQLLGQNVRSCQAVAQASVSPPDGNKGKLSKLPLIPVYSAASIKCQAESTELKCAENLIISLIETKRAPRNEHIEGFLEFLRENQEKAYGTALGKRLYLWCSGVLALTSALLCQKWFLKDDFINKAPRWFDAKVIQQALQGHFWGVPRDLIVLSVKATDEKIEKSEKECLIDQAAKDFKVKADECTASILNKLGIQLINSKQESQAIFLLEKAGQAGNASAIYNMGLCFEHGRGVLEDHCKAAELYEVAAARGHPKAQYNLATFYAEGAGGLTQDYETAIHWFQRAADNGIAKAQVCMGFHFAKENDQEKSANYFSLASNQQDIVGMYHYAICLEHGWGVAKDVIKAGKLYKKAADCGHISSMFNVAVFYEKGLGEFTKSRWKAMYWYEKAADFGDEEAKQRLTELRESQNETRSVLHPILKNIIVQSLFNGKQRLDKGFHKSMSAPNLTAKTAKLTVRGENDPRGIPGELTSSLSCSLQSLSSASSNGSCFSLEIS
ncbi:uncharacterized protein LOC135686669 isoform X1 [Rhopilema esculentum]|uniref:uncharacterized protein LOC135686669 isoform X1 n=1 Tax=Rhopilema esculentum TaxID=499914 RepID=UPI0031CF45F9